MPEKSRRAARSVRKLMKRNEHKTRKREAKLNKRGLQLCPACSAETSLNEPLCASCNIDIAHEHKRLEAVKDGFEAIAPDKRVTDYLGYELMFEDGICKVEDPLYSLMLSFSDISYQDSRYEEQKKTFQAFAEFLNSFDSDIDLQFCFSNQIIPDERIEDTMLLKLEEQPAHERDNDFRREINNMISSTVLASSQKVSRERYLVLTVAAENHDIAHGELMRAGEAAIRMFELLDSEMRILTGKQRLQVLYNILHPDDMRDIDFFDYSDLRANPLLATKDIIAPACLDDDGHSIMRVGSSFSQILHVTKYARTVKDEIMGEFLRQPFNLLLSEHIQNIEQTDAIDFVEQQLCDMGVQKTHEKRKNQGKFFYTDEDLPERLKDAITNAKAMRQDLQNKDQKMFKQTILFYTYASTLKELQDNIDSIGRVARQYQYKIEPLENMQRTLGLASVLPNGRNTVPFERQLSTSPLAAFMPFLSEELMQSGGAYYGENQLSKNPIFFSRKSLTSPNGLIVGKPGRGKSFAAKEEITNTLLSDPLASVDVIDPEREYSALAAKDGFGGEVIRIGKKSGSFINMFDISEEYSDDDDPLTVKEDLLLSIFDWMAHGLTAMQQSVCCRVIKEIYEPYFESLEKDTIPIFSNFHAALCKQPETEAKTLAVILERFKGGIFDHKTTVDPTNRLVIWDVKDLGKQYRTLGLLIVTDQVWNRITSNRAKGRRSYFYTDEWQLLLDIPYAVKFYDELWSRSRKWGAVPTIITQNIARVVKNERAKLMLANSDFLMLMGQSESDAKILRDIFNLSDAQVRHISSKRPGAGLLVADKKIIPFVNKFPEDTDLYRVFTTKFDDLSDLE